MIDERKSVTYMHHANADKSEGGIWASEQPNLKYFSLCSRIEGINRASGTQDWASEAQV